MHGGCTCPARNWRHPSGPASSIREGTMAGHTETLSAGQHPLICGKLAHIQKQKVTVRPELVATADLLGADTNQCEAGGGNGPGAPSIAAADGLAGKEVFVRKASAYYDTLTKLNAELKARGKPMMIIDEAPDVLEDDDVLEMVNAGLAPITVVDDYLAEFWTRCSPASRFTRTSPCAPVAGWRSRFARRTPGSARPSTSGSRSTERRRLPEHHRTPLSPERQVREKRRGRRRAAEARGGGRDLQEVRGGYKVDYLLMAAQGYQESTLDHSVKSPVGAIGVMQVMPPTGRS